MKYKDYYKLLDLNTSKVSIDEIKSAYRSAAKKYHPDLNVGDTQAEKRIKNKKKKNRILSSKTKKRKNDRIKNSRNNVKNYKNIKSKNIFSMFLGNVETSNESVKDKKIQVKGENVETEIKVKLEDAFYVLEKKISLRTV